MNARILNRNNEQPPADGWYQIEVSGEHRTADGRVQVIDAAARTSMVAAFNRAASDESFAGLLVDNDHLSHSLDKSTEAFGWLKELRDHNGQIEGRIEWTDLGMPAIQNKRFKFFSTEYSADSLENLGGGRVRPLALSGLALTNRPNNRGGKPISNRGGNNAPDSINQNKTMKEIAQALGLPEDADEAACVTAINNMKAAKKDADDTITNRESELTGYREREADAILAKHADKIGGDEGVKSHFRAQLITNRESTEKVLDALPAKSATTSESQGLKNRATSPPPVADKADTGSAEDNKKAAAIRNRAHAIMASEKLPFGQAFSRAQAELG